MIYNMCACLVMPLISLVTFYLKYETHAILKIPEKSSCYRTTARTTGAPPAGSQWVHSYPEIDSRH